MDKFITIKKQNNCKPFAREDSFDAICDLIEKNKNINVYGNSGVGKTFLIKNILKNYKSVELTHEILRSKSETINFLNLCKSSSSCIFVDDIDMDYQGWKEIVEFFKENKKISKGPFIIITKIKYENIPCEYFNLEPLTTEQIFSLGIKKNPNKKNNEILELANKCKGNLRIFFYSFEFSDERDILLSPKETVHNLLSPCDTNPSEYIGRTIDDHGYSWGIVHENYPRSSKISMDDVASISENMSIADVYDNYLYNGYWELNNYFCHEGIIHPCIKINQSLCRETLNPGSSWTKFNNYKMRLSKFRDVQHRQKRAKVDIDTIMVIRDKCQVEKIGVLPFLKTYNLKSQDMDIINHLCLLSKIKPKLLVNIKKELKKDG